MEVPRKMEEKCSHNRPYVDEPCDPTLWEELPAEDWGEFVDYCCFAILRYKMFHHKERFYL